MPLLRLRSNHGFLLFEVMVSISIIAIALTVALGMQSRSISMAGEAKFMTMASLLAQKKIAEIEATALNEITSDSGDFGEDYPEYRWALEISDPSFFQEEEISGRLKQIDLSVAWGDEDSYHYNMRLYRFLRNNG